jgi:hypothetical protein
MVANWEGLTRAISRHGFSKTLGGVHRPAVGRMVGLRPPPGGRFVSRAGGSGRARRSLARGGGGLDLAAGNFPESRRGGRAGDDDPQGEGAGFRCRVLPEIPDSGLPQAQHFDVAEGDGWICETPPKWARGLIPEMSAAEERWGRTSVMRLFACLCGAHPRQAWALCLVRAAVGEGG